MIGDIMQPTHLLLVLVVALLVLGPKRLPEVGRQLGKGIRDFRAAINGEHADHHDDSDVDHGHFSRIHEAPPQPAEHQFAHQTTESTTSQPGATSDAAETAQYGHDFGAEATEPLASNHQFADHAAEPVAEDHEFAHVASAPAPGGRTDGLGTDEPTTAVAPGQPSAEQAHGADATNHAAETDASRAGGKHEGPADPAQKPSDPA